MFNKKIIIWIFGLVIAVLNLNSAFAQRDSRGDYGTNPVGILNEVVEEANDVGVGYQVQDTALDYVEAGPGKYRIYNTLEWLRQHISPYLQWAVYIGLTVAVILLIYNGLMLVTGGLHEAGKWEKVRGNIMNILIGVAILTGFYVLFKVVIALINTLFGDPSTGI